MSGETIVRDELAALLENAATEPVEVVDVRPPWMYGIAHLPGAVNWPLEEEGFVERFEAGTRYVVYGVNRKQGKRLLERLAGVENVRVYLEGIRDWVAAQQPTEPEVRGFACLVCSFGYYAHRGDPRGHVEPGTFFEELPDDWRCPWCGAPKSRFMRE